MSKRNQGYIKDADYIWRKQKSFKKKIFSEISFDAIKKLAGFIRKICTDTKCKEINSFSNIYDAIIPIELERLISTHIKETTWLIDADIDIDERILLKPVKIIKQYRLVLMSIHNKKQLIHSCILRSFSVHHI